MNKYRYTTMFICSMCIVIIMIMYGYGDGIDAKDTYENNIDEVCINFNIDGLKVDRDELGIYDIVSNNIDITYDELDNYMRGIFKGNDYIGVIDAPKEEMNSGYSSSVMDQYDCMGGIYFRDLSQGYMYIYLATYIDKGLMYGGNEMESSEAEQKYYTSEMKKIFSDISDEHEMEDLLASKDNSSDKTLYHFYRMIMHREIEGINISGDKIIDGSKTDGEKIWFDFNERAPLGIQITNYTKFKKSGTIEVSKDSIKNAVDSLKLYVYANDTSNIYREYVVNNAKLMYTERVTKDGEDYYEPVIVFDVIVDDVNVKYTYSIKDDDILDFN